MVETIFTSELSKIILAWAFVFVLLFAILEKTQMLGEGKRQINAMLSLIVALILLAFPESRMFITDLIPFLVIAAVILFIFLLLYAFISGKEKDMLGKGMKTTLGIIVGIAVIITVLVVGGVWESVWNYLSSAGTLASSVLFIIIIGAVIAVVLKGGGKSGD